MKYPAIERSKDEFPVSRLCQTLEVSASGYYAWSKRVPSTRTGMCQGSMLLANSEPSRQGSKTG